MKDERGTMKVVLLAVVCMALAGVVYAADELSLTVNMNLSKGLLQLQEYVTGLTVDMSGDAIETQVYTASNTWKTITISEDIATPGYSLWRNLSTNYYMDVGTPSSNAFMRIDPEGVALLNLVTNSFTIMGESTNASPVKVTIIEE